MPSLVSLSVFCLSPQVVSIRAAYRVPHVKETAVVADVRQVVVVVVLCTASEWQVFRQ